MWPRRKGEGHPPAAQGRGPGVGDRHRLDDVAVAPLGLDRPALPSTARRAAGWATVTERGDGDGEGEGLGEGGRRAGRGDGLGDGFAPAGGTRMMRSSAATGVPRPSRLLVPIHNQPSGPTATARRRPYWPWNGAEAPAEPPEPFSETAHRRSAAQAAAVNRVSLA